MVNPVYSNKALATESQQYNYAFKYGGNAVQLGLSTGLKGGSPITSLTSFWLASSWHESTPFSNH
jgi:hypothetical protein